MYNSAVNASLVSVQFEDNFAPFKCTVNLAPKETAKLIIEAYIYAHELKSNYETVAFFNIPSKGTFHKLYYLIFVAMIPKILGSFFKEYWPKCPKWEYCYFFDGSAHCTKKL